MPAADALACWGVVPLVGRGSLPFENLHGQPLYLHALHAMLAVLPDTVVLVEADDVARVEKACRGTATVCGPDTWAALVEERRDRPLLVHDPLCPLVPAELLADFCARAGAAPATSYVAYRPVTDTVKTAVGGHIGATIDREALAALTSPLLVAAGVLGRAGLPLDDAEALHRYLRAAGPVELVVAPSIARRVDDLSAVHLLECVDELDHRLRH